MKTQFTTEEYECLICMKKESIVFIIPYDSHFKIKDLEPLQFDDAYFDADKKAFIGIKIRNSL